MAEDDRKDSSTKPRDKGKSVYGPFEFTLPIENKFLKIQLLIKRKTNGKKSNNDQQPN